MKILVTGGSGYKGSVLRSIDIVAAEESTVPSLTLKVNDSD